MAEGWMHIRSKYDGGKVINHSQSGSWEHRCMGAGLQQNLGKDWGPSVWSSNSIFSTTAEESKKKNTARKSQHEVKVSTLERIIQLRHEKPTVGMTMTLNQMTSLF